MKTIKIIFSSLLALSLIACTGIFLFFQIFDTDQYLPQITQKISQALGRPVSIGHVGLGFSARGITLDAGPLTVADDPNFTTQPFIKVDRVRISVDLKALVLQQGIHVTKILLQSPQIHFIRSVQEDINARSAGHAARLADNNAVIKNSKGNGITDSHRSPLVKDIPHGDIFNSIKIEDGSISFIDQSEGRPLDIWLSGINASLNNFSLAKPFRLSFDACLYSNDANVHGNTLVFLDLFKKSVQISNLGLHVDFSRLDIDGLKGISPQMPDTSILKDTSGAVQLNMAHLDIGAPGDFKANGNIMISNGLIKDFNIIKIILSRTLGTFGNMDGFIDKVSAKDTVIKKADVQFAFHDKSFFIDNSLIKTNIFELTAKGSVDQGLNVDMQTVFHLNDDVSAALVNQFDGFKYLMDDSKRISINAALKGVYPDLKYKPDKDFKKKSKKALMAIGGKILGVLF